MDALRRIHESLVPNGDLFDLQPRGGVSRVVTGEGELGRLDEREFFRDARAIDRLLAGVVASGLFALQAELHFVVVNRFDSGDELVATVDGFRRRHISRRLAARVRRSRRPFEIHEPTTLRRYGKTNPRRS